MSSDFDILWEKAQKEPETKVVEAKKVEFHLTVADVMDRYVLVATEAAAQNRMPREALDEIVKQTAAFKQSLNKAGPGHLIESSKKLGKRLIDRFL